MFRARCQRQPVGRQHVYKVKERNEENKGKPVKGIEKEKKKNEKNTTPNHTKSPVDIGEGDGDGQLLV